MDDNESHQNGVEEPVSFHLPEEKTKHSIRVSVWNQLEKANLINFPRPCWGRIPNFKGCDQASAKVVDLDEFKVANVIKVNPDKPQEALRASVLEHKKSLLVPIPRLREGLLNLVVLDNETTNNFKAIVQRRGIVEHGKPIDLDSKIKIDLVVIGSVAVSKEGYRIGKGEGFADLEFAMLMHMKAVDQNTIVITTVHDNQVFETLPKELFKPHDVPVDIIVTPTQVYRITDRLPKPTGVIWNILSQRRLNLMPVLEKLRKIDEGDGKDVSLREEDSDDETQRLYQPRYHHKRFKQFSRRRSTEKSSTLQTNNDKNASQRRRSARNDKNRVRSLKKDNSDDKSTGNDLTVQFELPEEKTKQSIKTAVMKYFHAAKLDNVPRSRFGVPKIIEGRDKACEKLIELDEFNEAKVVQVNDDISLRPVRIAVLKNKKKLLTPVFRQREWSMKWISVADDATSADCDLAVRRKSLINDGVALDIESNMDVDMIVVGSAIVSKDGYRMDGGNGIVDLQNAILMHQKHINQNTLIVTIVHDNQVFDSLPKEIFSPHDFPVDVIVTPTQIIRINPRLPKPSGIIWNLLSLDQLNSVPLLHKLREIDDKAEKDVTLRESSGVSEAPTRNGLRTGLEHRNRRKNPSMPRVKQDGFGEPADHSKCTEADIRRRMKRIFPTTKSYPRKAIEFSVRITNIDRNVRVKDLKAELAKCDAAANDITWRGSQGFCVLHYGRPMTGHWKEFFKYTNFDDASCFVYDSETKNTIINRLKNMQLGPNSADLCVEPISRIETTDITTV